MVGWSGNNAGMTGSVADRDRDDLQRPHNARPRDGLGRPLERGAEGVPRQPEGQRRSPDETMSEAQRLFDAGMPFHAHEVFEDAWKASTGSDRELWRGLAQLAVGATHAARGNQSGAIALLRRAAETIAPFRDSAPPSVDVGAILWWVDHAVALVERDCPVSLPAPPLT